MRLKTKILHTITSHLHLLFCIQSPRKDFCKDTVIVGSQNCPWEGRTDKLPRGNGSRRCGVLNYKLSSIIFTQNNKWMKMTHTHTHRSHISVYALAKISEFFFNQPLTSVEITHFCKHPAQWLVSSSFHALLCLRPDLHTNKCRMDRIEPTENYLNFALFYHSPLII